MGLLEDVRKRNSSGSLLRKYRSKFDISEDSINETLSSIKSTMENDRLKTVYDSQGVSDVQQQIIEKEKPTEGFLGIGLFSGAQRDYRDVFKRDKKDSEYRRQIEKNVQTISELLNKKKENPDKANDYNVMIQALQDKNKMLTEATGGDIKDLSTGQLSLRSLETATDVMPFGAGITQAGRAILKSGTKAVVGSLAKEGAATGIIGGAATAGQREDTTPGQFLGDVATSAVISAAATVGLGLGMSKLGEKVGNWLSGDKVDFTPKEKDALAEIPELQDETLFEQAGIESPIKKTDDDLASETISSTNKSETIAEILKDKIPDESTRVKVAKQLEVIEDPDEVKRIIDSYDPVKIREDLSLKIATTDNEKRIATFLKGIIPEEDIPTLSRTMKGMEDETQIAKLLDEFQIKEKPVLEAPLTESAKFGTPKKLVEREMTEQELATALAKKEVNRFKPDNPRFAANSKGVGMAYSSLKKRLSGDATAKEIKSTRKYLESNYIGKQVKVEGKTATVRRNAFGKVGIDFGDGKVKFYAPELVKAKKVTNENVIQKIIDDAKKELSGKQAIYKLDTKIKEEVIEPEVKKNETPKEVPKEQPRETKKAEPKKEALKKEESKSDKPNKSGLVKTLEKTAEKRGVKLKKEEIPRLASKMKMDDETKKAFKVYAENPQKAIEMAIRGEAPDGVRVGSLYTAVRDTAIIQNDIDTLYRLRSANEAKGAIEAAAEAGREVKSYDSAIMSDPVKIMRQVDDLKKEIAEKSGVDIKKDVKSAEAEIETFIEKNASTDSDLSKLVQKISC